MNEKYKRLTVLLADLIEKETLNFMLKEFYDDDQEMSDLINLVLSSHLSSMFTLMRQISGQEKNMGKLVDSFIKEVRNHISELETIISVEVI